MKKDNNKKYEIKLPTKSNKSNENIKLLSPKIPNELYYILGFKEKGKYQVRIICEDKGIFRKLIYEIICEKVSEYDFLKYEENENYLEFQLIEPIFNCIKIGNEVTFKIASTHPDIYFEDESFNFKPMDKVSDNIFEKRILLRTERIVIAKKEGNNYIYLFEFGPIPKFYNVVQSTTVHRLISFD